MTGGADDLFIDLAAGWRYLFLCGEFVHTTPPGDLAELRARLCDAAAKLNRWGGWSAEYTVPVARHSILVAAFAYARAEALGWPSGKAAAAVAEAAVHDLHEPLGLGDVLSPVLRWLESVAGVHVHFLVGKGEGAVRRLFGRDERREDWPEIKALVKLADADAAAVERGYACGDAPEWLGRRQPLAVWAQRKHSVAEGILGKRLLRIIEDPVARIRREFVDDWLLDQLGFETAEGRARLPELSGVPS